MKHSEKLGIKVNKTKPIPDFLRAIQFHLTKREQAELINELLRKRNAPTELIKNYADHRCRRNEGRLDATVNECWLLAQKNHEMMEKRRDETEAWGGR